jgi:hypothetical protein
MKLYLWLIFSNLILVGCTTVRSSSSGVDNVAHILLVSDNADAYPSALDISVGENFQFKARVVDVRKRVPKDAIVTFPAGQYNVTISQGNRVLYSQVIRLDIQQTRRIKLP